MPNRSNEYIAEQESYLERRDMLLKEISPDIIRKAWFTLSHLLLDEGAKVVDMGCDDGAMTYAMAAISPKVKFTGLDKSRRQITKAREKYSLHNLEFVIGDVISDILPIESFDAVINSYVLHEVYSGSRYNERIVSDTLKKHFGLLKKGGTMFIRDFARPPPGEFILIEMPDTDGDGETVSTMSEPDLLSWYSEHARPRQDPGCRGFFLEELPPRFPRTRLFRLPYRWAYEFLMRKDNRAHWELGLAQEYTFYTPRDFNKELRALGARVQYSGPHWEEEFITRNFEGKFKLYADGGQPLGHPPTSYIAVAHKMQERRSLYIEERRPTTPKDTHLKINAMKDEQTGRVLDIVTRGIDTAEIIPYRVDENWQLKIFLHDGVVRSIANAVPRSGVNLDERRWSGHMIEPLSLDNAAILEMEQVDVKNSARFSRDYLGLIPRVSAVLEKGPDYYPAPEYIEERVYTYYLNVEETKNQPTPKKFLGHTERFQAKGVLREMDAQQVLNAITVGMIPSARLELQILSLFDHLKLKAESWDSKNITFHRCEVTKDKKLHKMLQQYKGQRNRFRDVKGLAGELRPVRSTFVEEGQARGAVSGLAAQDVDFIVFDDKTVNTAIVLPLTKNMKDEVLAGFFLEDLPVAQKRDSRTVTLTAPSFNLPRNITNILEAKKFIADQFGVFPQMVFKMGESYYSHLGITPQKIHPFAVAAPPGFFEDKKTGFMPPYQVLLLRQKPNLRVDMNFTVLARRAYSYLHEDMKFEAKIRANPDLVEKFDHGRPEWSLPVSYHHPAPLSSEKELKKPLMPAPAATPPLPPKKPQPFHAAILNAPPPIPEMEKEPIPEAVIVEVAPTPLPSMESVPPIQADTPNAEPNAPTDSTTAPDHFEEDLDEYLQDLEQEEKNEPRLER